MVDNEIGNAQWAARRAHVGGLVLRGATEQHLDAGEQVVHIERLGDEVVGAELQTQEGVTAAQRAATDKDGDASGVLEHAAQDEPIFVGQDEVENDEVRAKL